MGPSPFHPDELAAQERAGGGAGGSGIRPFMPDQHRTFFASLPYLFVGTVDAAGWPLATVLAGEPGFVHSPDPVTLRIGAMPERDDLVFATFRLDAEVGTLGIDFASRRRNRANGRIVDLDIGGFTVAVHQSFGNCPQYIQRRAAHPAQAAQAAAREIEELAALDAPARELIERADTFFVASRSRSTLWPNGGADIAHRGGRPGFVQVRDDTLSVPDFRGNRYFNTLGNLLGDPRASLLFLDLERGDVLRLQGIVEIDWSGEAARLVEGALRIWRMRVVRGWRIRAGCPVRWSFVDYSPFTIGTGVWSR